MNNADAARKIAETLFDHNGYVRYQLKNTALPHITAKLDELFPVSESLKAVVREAVDSMLRLPRMRISVLDKETPQQAEQIFTEAVAPLLAEKDEKIAALETETARQKKRYAELMKPNFPT